MNISKTYSADVVICGGGVAGCAAGIAAARKGKRVILLERSESLGGICTNGYITGIAGHVDGICKEWVDRLVEINAAVPRAHLPSVEPEMGKIMLERMLFQAGAKVLYGVLVAECVVEDGRITDIIAYGKCGKIDIKAEVFVDATGDADVAFAAGCDVEIGSNAFMGLNESVTMGFRLAYVNQKKYNEAAAQWAKENKGERKSLVIAKQEEAIANGDLPYLLARGYLVYPIAGSTNEECMDITLDCTQTDHCRCTDVDDLTRQIVDQHRQVERFVAFLKKYVPGFENCKLEHMASMNGVRESRRVVGEYYMTGKDMAAATKFEDGIAIFPEMFDAHHPTSRLFGAIRHIHVEETELGAAVMRPSQDDDNFEMHPYVPMGGYEARCNPREFCEIPYRALVAKDVSNLYVVGRCFSADFDAQGGARVIATCMAMGQAAGIGASFCIDKGLSLRQLDGKLVREELKKQGVPFDQPLQGYWGKNRDFEGEIITIDRADFCTIINKEGKTALFS